MTVTTEFIVTPTEGDYVAASRAAYLANLRTWRGGGRVILLVVVVVGLVSAFEAVEESELGSFPLFMGGIGIVAAALGIAINLLWLPRKVRRIFMQQSAYREPITYYWSDEQFAMRSAISTIDIRWSQFFRWQEGRTMFLLYMTEYQSVFVPKRSLTDADANSLRAILTATVPRRR